MVQNTDGLNEEPRSSNNTLELTGLKWDHMPLVQVRNLDKEDDMIIGNSLFGDKVIEIDYDKKILIVHHQFLKDLKHYYTRHEVIFDQHRPKIQTSITINGKQYTDWFLFDTGRDGTMLIGEEFVSQFNLWDKFETLFSMGSKKVIIIPSVKLGDLTFRDIVTNARNPAHPNSKQSLLGNEILNHFNVILDNPNGIMYLKPNTLQHGQYATYAEFKMQVGFIAGGVLVVLIVLVWSIRRLISYRRKRKSYGVSLRLNSISSAIDL